MQAIVAQGPAAARPARSRNLERHIAPDASSARSTRIAAGAARRLLRRRQHVDVHGQRRAGALLPPRHSRRMPTSTPICSSISAATLTRRDVVLAISHVGRMPYACSRRSTSRASRAQRSWRSRSRGTPLAEARRHRAAGRRAGRPVDARRHRSLPRAADLPRDPDGRRRPAPRAGRVRHLQRVRERAAGTRRDSEPHAGHAVGVVDERKEMRRHDRNQRGFTRPAAARRHRRRRHRRAALRRRRAHRGRAHRRAIGAGPAAQTAPTCSTPAACRRAGIHRRPHPRRPDRARRRRTCCPRSARASPPSSSAIAASAWRRWFAPTCRRRSTCSAAASKYVYPTMAAYAARRRRGAARGERRGAGRPFDAARRDHGRSLSPGDARPSSARMAALLREGLAAGATGLSSGVFYATGAAADIDELALLAGIAGAAGGVYTTHIRAARWTRSSIRSTRRSRPRRRGRRAAGRLAPQVRRPGATGAARCETLAAHRSLARRGSRSRWTSTRTSPARRCCAATWSTASSTSWSPGRRRIPR